MAISNMQQSRQLRAGGGIMDLESRQGYFLGKIVRKAKKAAKKVFKSPLGKAALLGGAAYFGLGGGLPQFMGGSGTAGFGSNALGKYLLNTRRELGPLGKGAGIMSRRQGGLFSKALSGFNDLSPGKKALLGLGAGAVALPFLAGGGDEEEEVVESFSNTPGSISDIVSMAKAKDPSLRFMPNSQYVQKNFYAADGGIARLSMGGGAGQEQMMQALQAEYMKYKQQGGTMPFEQFAKLVMQQQQQGGQPTQMAADGGRMGYAEAGPVMEEDVEVNNFYVFFHYRSCLSITHSTTFVYVSTYVC
jgi:hypothetical protein